MFAVAQNRYTYLYDGQGTELHCLKMINDALRLEFLPYHFLLVASVRKFLHLYLRIMKYSIVSLWSPNVREPLVKIHSHNCPVRGLAVDHSGLYMATAGTDRSLKIWDLRNYKSLFEYKLPRSAEPLVFSQRGNLAFGVGTQIQIFNEICKKPVDVPYLTHFTHEIVTDLQFCPFEDVLGVGHRSGFVSLLVPGSGEPNIDAFEANPYQSKTQRRETEVKSLLDKIQPEMITLDSELIGKVDSSAADEILAEKLKILYQTKPDSSNIRPKYKTKGKSGGAQVFKRKQTVKEWQKKEFLNKRKRIERELIDEGILEEKQSKKRRRPEKPSVLDRFRKNI